MRRYRSTGAGRPVGSGTVRGGWIGLTVVGIHSPRFRFSGERATAAAGVEGLGVEHPVALDSDYAIWHDYGCKGWPSLFLWGPGGALACLYVMWWLPPSAWIRFGIWMLIGTAIYFMYGIRHSRLARPRNGSWHP